MASKEKGSQESCPIPMVYVCQDKSESNLSPLSLQVFRLTRCCAISAGMAEALAPLIFPVLS
jgi:hypothetical protein